MALCESTRDAGRTPEAEFSFLQSRRIVYLVNVDWFFISHRLPLARAARDLGAEVIVAAGDTGKGATLEEEGIRFVPLPLSRLGTNVLRECATVRAIYCFLRQVRPHLLHNVSIKPVLYGSLLSRGFGTWPVVNAVSGLGYVFSGDKKASFFRSAIFPFYKAALRNPRSTTIFQNPSDMETLLGMGFVRKEQAVLIRGSGVNCSRFSPTVLPERPVVMLPARMLWDKGVGEFVRVAEALHLRFPHARFVLVGPADDDNPKAISRKTIAEWTSLHPYIEWWGAKDPQQMSEVISSSTVVVLPSYHEGLPKALLEAAASGRPIVASDIPGCREIVRHNINGFLVPVGDDEALSCAVCMLLESPSMAEAMGKRGREIACSDFSEEKIIYETLKLYKKCFLKNN